MAASPHAPAVREALRSVRGAVADATEKLVAARDELTDRRARADGRRWKLVEGCVSRPEAEQRANELVAVLAARANAHLHPLIEPQVDGTVRALAALERVSATCWEAVREPGPLKAWMMARLDELAAQRGGWSELSRVERDRERRSVEHEIAVLDAASEALEREYRQATLVAGDWAGDAPGVTVEGRGR
jgi:hypothetical protein